MNLTPYHAKYFEESAYQENGVEYWLAHDLQVLLEYNEWRNFSKVILNLILRRGMPERWIR